MVGYFSLCPSHSPRTYLFRPQDESAHPRSSNYQLLDGTISAGSTNSAHDLSAEAGEFQRNPNQPTLTGGAAKRLEGLNSTNKTSERELLAPVRNHDDNSLLSGKTSKEDGQRNQWSNRSHISSSDPFSMLTPKSTPSIVPTAVHSSSSFPVSMIINPNAYVYAVSPPSVSEIVGSMDEYAIPNKIYRDAYYSNESDAPDNPREYAGLLYHLKGGEGLNTLEEWMSEKSKVVTSNAIAKTKGKGKVTTRYGHITSGGWEYASCPPSHREIKKWLTTDAGRRPVKKSKIPSQVGPPNATSLIEPYYCLSD